jgi:phage terminase small subunit
MGLKVPTAILEARGGFDGRKSRREARAKEPKADKPIGKPPKEFDATQKKIWKEIISLAHPGVLCLADSMWLEMTVRLVCEMRDGTISNQGRGQLQVCLGKLGMNPADRSRVQTTLEQLEPEAEQSPWELYISKPQQA